MTNIKDFILDRLRELDPKWIVSFITFAGTYVVTQLLGLNADDVLVDLGSVKVTWAVGIAFVAAHIAAWWKENAGTLLRRGEADNGNPDPNIVMSEGLMNDKGDNG